MNADGRLTRRQLLGLGMAGAAAGGLALAGCSDTNRGSTPDQGATEAVGSWGGDLFDPPLDKPDVTFTDLDGNPFPFREATEGRLSLLFFGYTSCPNECPIYLSTLASARESIRTGPGSRPQVLFVGVDTARDTPEVMRSYLAEIDPTFVGLTASPEVIDEALGQLLFQGIAMEEPDENGDYAVVHPNRAFAFTADDVAHRLYGYDTRQVQWVRDLPLLDQGEWQ